MMNVLDSFKRPLAGWIWEEIADLEYSSFYDAFCGASKVGSFFKQKGYQVFASDILHCHYWQAKALVENNTDLLTPDHYEMLMQPAGEEATNLFQAWTDHYFSREEVDALGTWRYNIENQNAFQENDNLKALAKAAVYQCIAYWTNFNQGYLQPKPMSPSDILKHYIQTLNDKVTDNQVENMAYALNAYELAPQLPADVIWINPPAMTGFRHTNRKTELKECWTRQVGQLNLEGVLPPSDAPQLGQHFDDGGAYLNALGNFLDQAQSSRVWVISYQERLGAYIDDFEALVAQKRSIWKKAKFDMPYPFSGGEVMTETEHLLIAVAE